MDEAVKAVTAMGKPLGLGIDAPMWWSAGEGGGRRADARLRERYGISGGTVQSGNSLQGAALIGGALLASRLREAFPGLRITESHPKALLLALRLDGVQFAARYGIQTNWGNEHERDAAIAAVCAREGFEGRWPTDLAKQRDRSEQNPSRLLARAHGVLLARSRIAQIRRQALGDPRSVSRFAALPCRGGLVCSPAS